MRRKKKMPCKDKAETGVMQLQARTHLESLEAGKGRKDSRLEFSEGKPY